MEVPEGVDPKDVHKKDPTNQVPLIEGRWVNGESFETFELKTYQANY